MTTAYTPLLGFALPTEGELDGAWGDVVNDNITSLLDSAIAGYATASVTSANWTLTTTGVGLPNQARMAILIPTGTPGVSRNIVAPSSSKTYIVINQSNASVVLKGAATTGLTILTGTYVLAAWNGSDFVQIGKSGTVTTTSVVSANGFAGSVATADTTPAITISTSITGMLKGNGTALSAATSGTDYLSPPAGVALLKANSGGALANATAGTDYLAPPSGTSILKANSGGALANATAGTDYVTPTGTETLTNKTITSRVVASTADTTPVAINSGTTDMATLIYTTAATTVTFSAPSGSPVNGQKLIIRIRTTNVQTLAWNAVFAGGTSTSLPTASSGSSKFDYFGFIYNDTVSKWQLIGTAFGY